MSNPLDNFRNAPLHFRAENNHPLQNNSDRYQSFENLSSYFANEQNYSMHWLFMTHKNSAVFSKVLLDMPMDLITRTMYKLAAPVYCDFTETNKNEDFLEICGDFYRELF